VTGRMPQSFALALLALAFAAGSARAGQDTPATDSTAIGTPVAAHAAVYRDDGLEALRPALAHDSYALSPGPRPYLHRFALTPSFGKLGAERLYMMRVAYYPNSWLGYEGELGHVPSQAVDAIVHRLNIVLRHPLSGRLQPYVNAGYGMTIVLPGRSVNADAVTKNMLALGGGLELYIRDDLALRAEMRRNTVFGSQANGEGLVAYDYAEQTLGLEFYRFIQP